MFLPASINLFGVGRFLRRFLLASSRDADEKNENKEDQHGDETTDVDDHLSRREQIAVRCFQSIGFFS